MSIIFQFSSIKLKRRLPDFSCWKIDRVPVFIHNRRRKNEQYQVERRAAEAYLVRGKAGILLSENSLNEKNVTVQ